MKPSQEMKRTNKIVFALFNTLLALAAIGVCIYSFFTKQLQLIPYAFLFMGIIYALDSIVHFAKKRMVPAFAYLATSFFLVALACITHFS